MIPPWERYPEIPRFSVGWRMGYGESYYNAFYRWDSQLEPEAAGQYAGDNPEPEGWRGFYGQILRNPRP